MPSHPKTKDGTNVHRPVGYTKRRCADTMKKLDFKNTAELVKFAISEGYTSSNFKNHLPPAKLAEKQQISLKLSQLF